jgi:hypothetical protein
VDIIAGLDTEARGKFFAFARDRTPVIQSIVRQYSELPQVLMMMMMVVVVVVDSNTNETAYSQISVRDETPNLVPRV